jgi:Domain of unknown function (DUF4173)
LFVLLNLLVLIVNVGDINYLLITKKLPAGISYSQFVHQGINALITSIIIAIAIVLFYFRGGLNFFAKSKAIKVLACIWILQNAFMVYSTSCRNTLYITECGLTYKRIGVYVYLLLALTGLITTFIKIIKLKSNSFLFRANGWIFYVFLIILSFPNWDRIITQYNVKNGTADYPGYVLSLSYSNITDLLPLYEKSVNDKDSINYNGFSSIETREEFSNLLYGFLSRQDTLDWRSWCYEDSRILADITNKDFVNEITNIDLSNEHGYEINPERLKVFNKVTVMNLHYSEVKNLKALTSFPLLQNLDISYDGIRDLTGIEKLQNLQYLDISGSTFTDYTPLYKLKNLKTIQLSSYYSLYTVIDELSENMPNVKIIKS